MSRYVVAGLKWGLLGRQLEIVDSRTFNVEIKVKSKSVSPKQSAIGPEMDNGCVPIGKANGGILQTSGNSRRECL